MQPYPIIHHDLQYNFQNMRGGGVEGRLEFFRKFIRFGTATLPLCVDVYLGPIEIVM